MRAWRGFRQWLGTPSVFDMCAVYFVCAIPFVRFIPGYYDKIYFVYGAIILWGIGLTQKAEREYHNKWLGLLTIWAVVNVFMNNVRKDPGFMSNFYNWGFLNEGFIFLFGGILFIVTMAKHAKAFRWLYFPVAIILCSYYTTRFNVDGREGNMSMSPVFALLMATVVVLWLCRKKVLAFIMVLGAAGVAWWKWDHVMDKLRCRGVAWWSGWEEARLAPSVGETWDNTVNSVSGFKYYAEWDGLAYRQNDYLEYIRIHGLPGLALVLAFIYGLLRKERMSIAYWLGILVLILCMTQRTIYWPVKAHMIGVIAALWVLETETGQAKSFSPKPKEEVVS